MNIICVQVFSQDIGDDLVVTIPGVEKKEIRMIGSVNQTLHRYEVESLCPSFFS